MSTPFERLLPRTESAMVTISREWHKPEIRVSVSHERIELAASIDDFMRAVSSEMGSPALMFTRAQLDRSLALAAASVVEKLKVASGAAAGRSADA